MPAVFQLYFRFVQRKRPSENLTNDGIEGGVADENGLTSLMSGNPHRLSDRQWAVLILLVFSVVALLVAFVLQRFIPSTHTSAGAGMNGADNESMRSIPDTAQMSNVYYVIFDGDGFWPHLQGRVSRVFSRYRFSVKCGSYGGGVDSPLPEGLCRGCFLIRTFCPPP